jgi:hypothetical protein
LQLGAEELESLHIQNLNLPAMGRWTLRLHTRFRGNYDSGNLFQVRGGPIVGYGLSRNLALTGGYNLLKQEDTTRPMRDSHRGFGGVQMRVADRGRWGVDARWMGERHVVDGAQGFTRLRQRISFTRRGRWQPFASTEALWVQRGGWIGRYSVGFTR